MSFLTRTKQRAFNLLEVVIASFIFSAVAVAFLGVWGLQVRSLEKSRHRLVASLLAEEYIEQSMSDGFERTPLTAAGEEPFEEELVMETERRDPRVASPDDENAWQTIEVKYRIQREVIAFGDDADKLKQVLVTVSWDDTSGNGKIVLETYLAGLI